MEDNILKVFWDEFLVGHITSGRFRRELIFKYTDNWIEDKNLSISFSLPCSSNTISSDKSTNFFTNLLPEGNLYQSICTQSKLDGSDYFKFLSLFGRECAGALCIVPLNEDISSNQNESYDDITDQIQHILEEKKKYPFYNLIKMTHSKLSLAGTQDKLPVHLIGDRIFISNIDSHSPTTWILKPSVPHFNDLIQNELFCMRLASAIGLTVPETKIMKFGDENVYLVRRFDRILLNDTIKRIHQEDFCQALGLGPEKKYQIYDGPGFSKCSSLINNVGINNDKDNFIRLALFNYLIGNCDAHAKNFSIAYHLNGNKNLTPFYDLVSTMVYLELDQDFAMSYGNNFRYNDINRNSWDKFAIDIGVSIDKLNYLIEEITRELKKSMFDVADRCEKEYGVSPIYNSICNIIKRGLAKFEEGNGHPPPPQISSEKKARLR